MQFIRLNTFFLLFAFFSLIFADGREDIRLNQVGFYTYGPKTAVIVSPKTWYFSIRSTDLRQIYYRGELSATRYWSSSGDSVKIADFSDFTEEGTYVLFVSGIGASYQFTISGKVNYELSKGLIRHFYYQRASTDLLSDYAGRWSRRAGHYDTKITIHPSAASPGRAAGSEFPSPKGWYDAGDYGKYIVNAGISTYQLLLLYEQFPEYFDTLSLNIPESDNEIPDLLDEIKWELDWMLTMQDPYDGGVYHKLTGLTFIGNKMPDAAQEDRYFIGKSTTASFDFAAVCAVAYRVFKKFHPSFADSCLNAAMYAYKWALDNPQALFLKNPEDVLTGEYRDNNASDEYQWASWELYLATDSSIYQDSAIAKKTGYSIPSWQTVSLLGMYSMALVKNDSFAVRKVSVFADDLLKTINNHPFKTSAEIFYWGSNGNVANEGMALLVAFLISKDCRYLEGAIHALDYLLGRNGPGFSFVTGFGTRAAMNPHHRPSIADGIVDPVPGFLVGGPNKEYVRDECGSAKYPEKEAKRWVDMSCSYSTNEIAINWNAPAAFLAGGIEAVFNSGKFNIQPLIDKYGADNIPPDPGKISVLDISADKAKISWSTSEKVSVTVQYGTDSLMRKYEMILRAGSDSGQTSLSGLMPETKYYVRISWVDRKGNVSSAGTSFTTEPSEVVNNGLLKPVTGDYICGRDLTVSFKNIAGVNSRLVFAKGGSSVQDTLSCSENNGDYSVKIPGVKVTEAGIIYSLLLQKNEESVETRKWFIGADSIELKSPLFSLPNTYQLVSFPLVFSPVPSIGAFSASIGDTARWRYFGYDPLEKSYILFDTLRSGKGGWIICKEEFEISIKGKNLLSDTLFPIVLKKGYNCVGNPFPFLVYWSNSVLHHDNTLISVTDSVARQSIRHQIFLYEDNTSNRENDGKYYSNRELISHKYNDSIQLKPWEGCWVYAEKDSVVLLLNPSAELNAAKSLAKKQNKQGNAWYYRISAISSGGGKQEAVLGAAFDAKDTYDEYDSPEPPPISTKVQIGFLNPEWNKHNGMYISDIKSCTGNHQWNLCVRSFVSGPVFLKWEKAGDHEGYLYLKDVKSGDIVDITTEGSYSFEPVNNEDSRNFIISWVPQKKPLDQMQIRNWNFYRDRNELSSSLMRFRYSVPSSIKGKNCRTVIEVFDVKGRCVRRILDEKKEPGVYTVNWDGRNVSGGFVANGFYVVRLFTEEYSGSIGVNLLR